MSSPPSRARRLLQRFDVDRAVVYALLVRVWQLLGGAVSVVLIAWFFAPEVQGFYYTFAALMALQSFFDLGFGIVVSHAASHEWAGLQLDDAGRIAGRPEALSRIVSLGRLLFRWYGIACGLFVVAVGAIGWWFLSLRDRPDVDWMQPWCALTVLSGLLLWTLPFHALLEGCDQAGTVNQYRLLQAVTANVAVWTGLALGLGLWVAVSAVAARLACDLYLLLVRYRRFFAPFRRRSTGPQVDWRGELWPLQWRIGLQGLAGYFAHSLYTPVMFYYHDAATAGRMGMSWQLVTAIMAAGQAWVQTRTARFGMLVAGRDWPELDRQFRRVTVASLSLLSIAAVALCGLTWLLNAAEFRLGERLLDPLSTALFVVAAVLTQLPMCQAYYIRAHRREPLTAVTLAYYTATGGLVWLLGSRFGPLGAAAGWLAAVCVIQVPLQTLVWRRCRREWHGGKA